MAFPQTSENTRGRGGKSISKCNFVSRKTYGPGFGRWKPALPTMKPWRYLGYSEMNCSCRGFPEPRRAVFIWKDISWHFLWLKRLEWERKVWGSSKEIASHLYQIYPDRYQPWSDVVPAGRPSDATAEDGSWHFWQRRGWGTKWHGGNVQYFHVFSIAKTSARRGNAP